MSTKIFPAIFSICLFFLQNLNAQKISKPMIDSAAIANWESVGKGAISNNGEYISYQISQAVSYENSHGSNNTFVVLAANSSWKKEFKKIDVLGFSGDSKRYIYKSGDSLCFLLLGTDHIDYIGSLGSVAQPKEQGKWLFYEVKGDTQKKYILRNLLTGKEQSFERVTKFQFDDSGTKLVIQTTSSNGMINRLEWVNLSDEKIYTIWTSNAGAKTVAYSFDAASQQLVFAQQQQIEGRPVNTLWYYKEGKETARVIADSHNTTLPSNWWISSSANRFRFYGEYIVFTIAKLVYEDRKPDPAAVDVDINNYKDEKIHFGKSFVSNPNEVDDILMDVNIKSGLVTRIQQSPGERELLSSITSNTVNAVLAEYILLQDDDKRFGVNLSKNWLVSLKDGSRKLLFGNKIGGFAISISPDHRWIIYFDREKQHYRSYEIETGKTRDISSSIPTRFSLNEFYSGPKDYFFPYGIGGWLADSRKVLLYDQYDIWEVDPSGRKPAVNMTNGYGRFHHTRFRSTEKDKHPLYAGGAPILLKAFNDLTKEQGFYRIVEGNKSSPELLSMNPVLFQEDEFEDNDFRWDISLLKARDAAVWLMAEQSPTHAPNYFLTNDLKSYRPISNLQPQKQYNWFTTEILNYKLPNGKPAQGILYKPEDFDPHKKYPVIVLYYEKVSDGLNLFLSPRYSTHRINIPWFVSHGYLVFTPDIYYTLPEKAGQNALNSVVPAARFVARLPYVDPQKMAINGHSFGGFETNYIVTHSHLFAAACSASGASDFISFYSLYQDWMYGQGRMGTSPAENPAIYIENSPVLKALDVTTPILYMCNKNDFAAFPQGVEFYTQLKVLDKKVWMLQYTNGGHWVGEGKPAVDFTKRMEQFFDHYLKGAPAPVWMTRGIPARLKQIETGYALDSAGNCGPDCKVCKKINEIYNLVHHVSTGKFNERDIREPIIPDDPKRNQWISKQPNSKYFRTK